MRSHKKPPNDSYFYLKKRPKFWEKCWDYSKRHSHFGDQVVKNRNYEDVKKELKQSLLKMARAGRLNTLK